MKELLTKLLELKEEERKIKEERYKIEGEIYDQIENRLDDDKTVNFQFDEYKLSVKPTFSVKVDQEKAATLPQLFKVKYEMTYSQYKKIGRVVDDMITINQNKPSFSVEKIDV